jgi:hypothetical protein
MTSENSVSEVRKRARKVPGNLPASSDFHYKLQGFVHAANLRHGTDGITSPPKEGMLRIFSSKKFRRLRPGSDPRTWVPEASMLTTRPPKPLSLGMWSKCINTDGDFCFVINFKVKICKYGKLHIVFWVHSDWRCGRICLIATALTSICMCAFHTAWLNIVLNV